MPTKPVLGAYLWASDVNYSTGPAALLGTPTKVTPPLAESDEGWKADQSPPAQWENFSVNAITQWTEWVRLGSNAFAEDAHVVESNATGVITAPRMLVGSATLGAGAASMSIFQPAAAGGRALEVFNNTGTDETIFALHSAVASAAAVIHARQVNGSGPAILAELDIAATGDCIVVTHAVDDVASAGVQVTVTGGAGQGIGSSTDEGYACALQTTDGAAARAPLRIVPRAVEPGTALDGDIYYDSADDRLRLRSDFLWRSLWHTTEGLARRYAESLGETSFSAGGTQVAKVTIAFVAADNLRSGTTVHLRGVCEIGSDAARTDAVRVGFRDTTAGVDIVVPRNIRTFEATGAADEQYIVIEADYTLPLDGARTFILGRDGNGVDTAYIRNASLEITGQY